MLVTLRPVLLSTLMSCKNRWVGRLHTRRLGSFQVIGNKGNSYTLFYLVTKKELTTNVSRMVPFYFDSNRIDPQSVVAHDSNEFIVESVFEHEWNLKLKKSLLFKVRFLGYDASQDTLESWKKLNSVDKLHSHLYKIGHPNAIPRRFLFSNELLF